MSDLYIGMMSGTSMDGIDAALVRFESPTKFETLGEHMTPYPNKVRQKIASAAQNNQHLAENTDSPLHLELANIYAHAAKELLDKAGVAKDQIKAIANHGQTVKHEPNATKPVSLQLGCGQTLANATGIRTITQFRQADLAAGGQGAPLMPAFHRAAFGEQSKAAVLNLGGIANLTILGAPLIGFDTGPGNCLLDRWIEHNSGLQYDENGLWAKSGAVDHDLLDRLLGDEYFKQPPPKSTGTDIFNLDWLARAKPQNGKPEDIQATLLALTIETVARSLEQYYEDGFLWVCGGGAANAYLMQSLQQRLVSFEVSSTDQAGVNSDYLEAIGFAWLGYCFDQSIPSNVPSVTGAAKDCVLGELFEPH